MHDIYPDLSHQNNDGSSSLSASLLSSSSNHQKRPPLSHTNVLHSAHTTSSTHSTQSVHNTAANNIATRPPHPNYPTVISNHHHQHYQATTNRPPYSSSNSYKPHNYHRPSAAPLGGNGAAHLWDQDLNHLSGSVTNHLDNYFEVDQGQSISAGINGAEPLPNPQAFAVGNVLDLNEGDEGEDYGYSDNSYRPVPGTTVDLITIQIRNNFSRLHLFVVVCF